MKFEAPMKLVLHSKRLRLMTPDNLVATVEGIGQEFQKNHGERLAATWNACHGLALPPDIAPGAVAALVALLRSCADDARANGSTWGSLDTEDITAALAPFTTDPAPVSPWPLDIDPAHGALSLVQDYQNVGSTAYSYFQDGAHVGYCPTQFLEPWAVEFNRQVGERCEPVSPEDLPPVSPPEEPEPRSLPAGFNTLATSPSLEGIRKHVAAFYGGETKEFRMHPGGYSIHKADGTRLSPQVIRTRRGYYFGTV